MRAEARESGLSHLRWAVLVVAQVLESQRRGLAVEAVGCVAVGGEAVAHVAVGGALLEAVDGGCGGRRRGRPWVEAVEARRAHAHWVV